MVPPAPLDSIKAKGKTIGPNFNDVVTFGITLKSINYKLIEVARAGRSAAAISAAAIRSEQGADG
jgi:hypothetical protein